MLTHTKRTVLPNGPFLSYQKPCHCGERKAHNVRSFLFVMCAVCRSGPSSIVAIRFAALMLGTVLTVLNGWVFTQILVAVVFPAIQILAAVFSQLPALKTPAVDTVGFKIPDRQFAAPVTHILLEFCGNRLCCSGRLGSRRGWFLGCSCCTVRGRFCGLLYLRRGGCFRDRLIGRTGHQRQTARQ